MDDGFKFTKDYLAPHKDIIVTRCSREDIHKEIIDTTVLVPLMSKINRDILSNAKKLKMILQFGVGIEGIDLAAAKGMNILVANIKSSICGNAQSCAEHAIFLALSLLRNTHGMKQSLLHHKLGFPTGKTLYESRILIYGFGDLGQYLSSRLKSFQPKQIIAIGRKEIPTHNMNSGYFYDTYGTITDFPHLAKDIDIIFLTCSQNSSNMGFVNKEFLKHVKKSCVLVNIARGGLLNYTDVEEALRNNTLAGLGMDVYHTEPFPIQDSIFELTNVIATPHVAGVTEVAYRSMARIVGENVVRLQNNQRLEDVTLH